MLWVVPEMRTAFEGPSVDRESGNATHLDIRLSSAIDGVSGRQTASALALGVVKCRPRDAQCAGPSAGWGFSRQLFECAR